MKKKKYLSDLTIDFIQSAPPTPEEDKMIREAIAAARAKRETREKQSKSVLQNPSKKKTATTR